MFCCSDRCIAVPPLLLACTLSWLVMNTRGCRSLSCNACERGPVCVTCDRFCCQRLSSGRVLVFISGHFSPLVIIVIKILISLDVSSLIFVWSTHRGCSQPLTSALALTLTSTSVSSSSHHRSTFSLLRCCFWATTTTLSIFLGTLCLRLLLKG